MRTRTRTEITVETTEILVVHRRGSLLQCFCQRCGEQVGIIRLEEAALAGISMQSVWRAVEADHLHLVAPADGLVFMCLNSLFLKDSGEAATRLTCSTLL
jgi:site-specific recombinase